MDCGITEKPRIAVVGIVVKTLIFSRAVCMYVVCSTVPVCTLPAKMAPTLQFTTFNFPRDFTLKKTLHNKKCICTCTLYIASLFPLSKTT